MCRPNHSISAAYLPVNTTYKEEVSPPYPIYFPNNTPTQAGWYPPSFLLFPVLDLLYQILFSADLNLKGYLWSRARERGWGLIMSFQGCHNSSSFSPKNTMSAGKSQDLRGRPPLQSLLKFAILHLEILLSYHMVFSLFGMVFNLFGMIIYSSSSPLQPTVKALPVRCGVETRAGIERRIGADRFRPL